ncbi:MAG: hypothetical protein U9R43_11310 [Thermodesulfobacteriota bacterium]|nr:hypothetical protein [Thermodesulfobacteriota bacterium]
MKVNCSDIQLEVARAVFLFDWGERRLKSRPYPISAKMRLFSPSSWFFANITEKSGLFAMLLLVISTSYLS